MKNQNTKKQKFSWIPFLQQLPLNGVNNFIIFILFLIITVILFYKWVLQFSESILGDINGDGSLLIWILHWPLLKINNLFDANYPSYLDSNIFFGFSNGYSFSEMFPLFLPLILLLDYISHNSIINQNVLHLFFIILFPFSLYIFLRELKISFISSLIISLILSFTPFHMIQFKHFQQTVSSVIPILLIFLFKFLYFNRRIYLLYFCILWTFLAGVSTHSFLFSTFSASILILSYVIFILKSSNYRVIELVKNLRERLDLKNLLILFLSIIIILFIVYPYYYNSKHYGFTRLRVESLLFELNPRDYQRLGFDPVTILLVPISFYFFLQKTTKEILIFRYFFLLSLLIYLISLGSRPYYPNTFLYKYYPGFSSIRDISRILVLFWIFFAYCSAFALDKFIESKKLNKYIKISVILFFISIEIFLISNRITEPSLMKIPEEINNIHKKLIKDELKQPLLVVTEINTLISYTEIDSIMQYKSIENKKILAGGYSGYMPYNLLLLRQAIASYISGNPDWKEKEILQVLNKSPINSIAFINIPSTWKSELPDWRNSLVPEPPICKRELTGKWRNLNRISKNYGLVLGYTPVDSFCVSDYGKINDIQLKVLWKKEGKPYYEDILKVTSPFYRHPSAQELLYSLDGFRDRGFYTLEIYQEDKMIYEGVVEVH